jgi:hypothetical protein
MWGALVISPSGAHNVLGRHALRTWGAACPGNS